MERQVGEREREEEGRARIIETEREIQRRGRGSERGGRTFGSE